LVELTKDQELIVHIMLILLNPFIRDRPFDIREQFIIETLRANGIPKTSKELEEIVNQINTMSKHIATDMFKFLIKRGIDFRKMDPNDFNLGL
jgi:hypothetical protein